MTNPTITITGARRAAGLTLALGLGLVALALLLASAAARPAHAAGTDIIVVNPGGSIQTAINNADPGDTIQINAGVYTESLTLTKTVSLVGANAATTFIQAMPGQRVITVSGAAVNQTVLIAHLTLQGGDVDGGSTCPQNCGGGMALINAAQPRLQGLVFRNNAAWQGGGLFATAGQTLTAAVFQNNTAAHNGGGLTIDLLSSLELPLTLTDTQFISNTAGEFGGGAFVFGPARISGGLFERNRCNGFNCAGGGSISRGLTVSGTQYISNTSQGKGGGASSYFLGVTVTGGQFAGNRCLGLGCQGGGLNAEAGAVLTATQFISNSSEFDGGGVRAQGGPVVVTGGRFERNTCTNSVCSGGGLAAFTLVPSLVLVDTDFYSNTVGFDGGGLRAGAALVMTGGVLQGNTCTNVACGGGGLNASNSANLSGVTFTGNTAQNGGGGAFFSGPTTVADSVFAGNDCLAASCNGGGLRAENNLTLSVVQFVDNASVGAGGGVAHVNTSGDLRVENALFADNTANALGVGLWAASTGDAVVLHSTFANAVSTSGAAVGVAGGTLGLTNTIVANYSVGFNLAVGVMYEDYTLFNGVATPTTGGVTSGPNHPTGNPLFANPAARNYRLLAGSAALDEGFNVGVLTDFEGDPRPFNLIVDLGYDEFTIIKVYLPLVLK